MISVTPTAFTKVEFQLDEILAVAEEVRGRIAGTTDVDLANRSLDVIIREDEATARMEITSLDPLAFTLDSGALEDTRVPRHLGVEMASVSLASLYVEALDRMDDSFGAPDLGEPTDLADKVAWSVYTHTRVQRAGYRVYKPKHLYNFRNRHGFSDAADQAFEAIWVAEGLTYAELLSLCPARG